MPRHLLLCLLALLPGACTFPKHLDYGSLQSPAMAEEMAFAVYTPPGWTRLERLPLVVFLHGGGDDVDCFDRAAMAPVLDAAVAAGTMPRVVICIPQGDLGFWENWHDGTARYRDWVMDDLLPHVRRAYHTLPGRKHTHLMGISMGGHGALRFALKEERAFASIAAISAPVMDATQLIDFAESFLVRTFLPVEEIWGPTTDVARIRQDDIFARWRTQGDLDGTRFMLVYGTADRAPILAGGRRFHEHLRDRGVDHAYFVYDGAHKWVDWRPILPMVIRTLVGGA